MGKAMDRLRNLALGTSKSQTEKIAESLVILAQEIDRVRERVEDHFHTEDQGQ